MAVAHTGFGIMLAGSVAGRGAALVKVIVVT